MSVTDAVYAVNLITDSTGLFLQPPLSWFVYIGLIAAGIGVVSKFVRRR